MNASREAGAATPDGRNRITATTSLRAAVAADPGAGQHLPPTVTFSPPRLNEKRGCALATAGRTAHTLATPSSTLAGPCWQAHTRPPGPVAAGTIAHER
jgi:hypothetical protein